MDNRNDTWRIMDYTGDLPYWKQKIEGMKDWKTKFDADKAAKEVERRKMLGLPSEDSLNNMYKF